MTLTGGTTQTPTPSPNTTTLTTGEVPPSLLAALGKSATDVFTTADINKVIQWFKDTGIKTPEGQPVFGNTITGQAAESDFRKILAKYATLNLPINTALPSAGKESGSQDPLSLGLGVVGLTKPNFNFDIPGAIMFLGVILIGLTFIFVGGIITLRKR